jgi:hypothetical protein
MNVQFLPETRDYFEELVTILYRKGYFSWLDQSRRYVDELVVEILTTLPTKPARPAPPHYNRYGKGLWYASFRKNRHTTWYAFFTRYDVEGETVWLVRHITNNHAAAQYL